MEEEGSLTVPARLLTEFVASLPSDQIDIVMTPRPRSLQLTCARSQANINGTDAEDFPPIPTVEDGLAAKIDPQVLRTAIGQVAFAAATEESRPVLTGVKLDMSGDQFTMVAADGFRLALHRGQLMEPVAEPIDVILPARTLNELNRFLGGQEEPVDITVTPAKGQALFRLENIELVSQLMQGTFPSYSQLIPESYQTRTVFDLKEFLRAARSTAIFARDGSGIIRLQMTPNGEAAPEGAGQSGNVIVSARAEEMGDNQDEVDTIIEGEESKIAFNSKYLLEVLSVLERGQVALETSTPSSPGVFKPIGSDSYIHVVMPMFVQW